MSAGPVARIPAPLVLVHALLMLFSDLPAVLPRGEHAGDQSLDVGERRTHVGIDLDLLAVELALLLDTRPQVRVDRFLVRRDPQQGTEYLVKFLGFHASS